MLTRRLYDTCLPNLIKAQLLNLDRFGYLTSRIIESCTVSFFIGLSVFIQIVKATLSTDGEVREPF